MASTANVRAELKSLPHNANQHERDAAFRILLSVFKRRCNEFGVMKLYKQHEFFESEPVMEKRKRKEAHLRRLKDEAMFNSKNGTNAYSSKADRKDRRN